MQNKLLQFCLGTALAISTLPAQAASALDYEASQPFIDRMQSRHGFNAQQLTGLLGQSRIREDILEAISRPAEKKPWYQYRPIFVTPARVNGGLAFWDKHEAVLERAEQEYGVPAEIIVAIIGVETRYGKHTGRYRVIDALSTLAFAYPPRSTFFASELEHYLLMTREEQVDPLSLKGSYAGAMGQPQFISSSFRSFAVDFDADGKRDIWNNPTDAIGSVANYFRRHGWRNGEPITARVNTGGVTDKALLASETLKPSLPLAELQAKGVEAIPEDLPPELLTTLIGLELEENMEYWLGLHNFYVITRYNHSALYAMAVYQLSQEIRAQREAMLNNVASDN
ncbi:MAG: lytic murein transglycosylase B [Granulosicoccaceae bacterium]|jgi:membrane-bound lytic murein transglycosylase B